mmetsp:Transcript_139363/g.347453  ORF Transcript_139363/g.347453 Transcript_139363/m.347453 type:complete len:201 (-) Transcript_139363:1918-2520(-)
MSSPIRACSSGECLKLPSKSARRSKASKRASLDTDSPPVPMATAALPQGCCPEAEAMAARGLAASRPISGSVTEPCACCCCCCRSCCGSAPTATVAARVECPPPREALSDTGINGKAAATRATRRSIPSAPSTMALRTPATLGKCDPSAGRETTLNSVDMERSIVVFATRSSMLLHWPSREFRVPAARIRRKGFLPPQAL